MNIILGVYNGYNKLKTEKGGIYYFVKSLRNYNKTCRIIILSEQQHIFNDLTEFCNENTVELYSNFIVKYNLTYYRFEIYNKILTTIQQNNPIHRILLSDINDVIFQEDPFQIKFSEDLYCATEKNILSDPCYSSIMNKHWIQECNNILPYSYTKFINQPVICAGTILGSYDGIKRYLDFYTDIQTRKIVNDQGLLNIYIYNYLESKITHNYKESKILTLDSIQFNELHIKNSKIVNNNGEIYSILHQIDRCNLKFMLDLVENH